jgi:hypothetical protein
MTMESQRAVDWPARVLRSWHLAILRFVVTRYNADRLGVLAIAGEIDRLGQSHEDEPDFGFFRKISAELCSAVLERDGSADVTLQRYLARIDDLPLKRAVAAALDLKLRQSAGGQKGTSVRAALWRGLPSRGSVRH